MLEAAPRKSQISNCLTTGVGMWCHITSAALASRLQLNTSKIALI